MNVYGLAMIGTDSRKFIIEEGMCPVSISFLHFDMNLGFVKDFIVF